VREFIQRCRDRQLKLAIATSADEVKMSVNLQEVGLAKNIFDAIVNGLEVERKKPFPDVFILAANKLGLQPENCLVVEDAINGVIAAKAAGCKCLALTTSFDGLDLKDADWIAKDLLDAPDVALSW
jgi:beta-phosphoglucomutase